MAHTQIKSKHHAQGSKCGAIAASNHFKQTNSPPIKKLVNKCHKKLHIVIEDSNLRLPGFLDFLMNDIDVISIAQSCQYLEHEFPKRLQQVFDKEGWILIYPEQEMWYNYRKPCPLQKGVYYYAVETNIPITSCFVEIQDLPEIKEDSSEFHKARYILHVLPTTYPIDRPTVDQNAKRMRGIDYLQRRKAYKRAYGKKLSYSSDDGDTTGYVKK